MSIVKSLVLTATLHHHVIHVYYSGKGLCRVVAKVRPICNSSRSMSFVDTSIYYSVVIMSVDSEYALWQFSYTCPPCPTNSAWFENMHV
jgi:hypothetical protein